MTSHRPSIFIAAAAAGILGALYFVPNASATAERTTKTPASVVTSTSTTHNSDTSGHQQLADTGAVETTPYLIGGTAFLGIGAALVTNASRRIHYEA